MLRVASWLTGLSIALVACSAPVPPSASPTIPAASDEASVAPSAITSPIVGVWRGEHECEGIVQALADAGFDESVIVENVVGNGLIPAAPDDITDMTALCQGATTLEHSHEFTADGRFFSYNEAGEEVDSNTYSLIDDDTVLIGGRASGATFDFDIEGDHLTLEPQGLPEGCREFRCQWAVMVAMQWSGMERVE